ncbi:hypothetical protein [Haloferula sp. BvORR071]|uniref:hypothetical protein n=1 Tax=Haloferula sp. BvORR071 TaxID=1396141 RepID=UPI000555F052|nr:hypothetical protein [Haloferula sp. BvORR071]
MKPTILLPPALALAAAAIWLGMQHRSLSAVQDQNTTLREQIASVRSGGADAATAKPAGSGKNNSKPAAAKKINWKELAAKQKQMERGESIPDMRAMIEIQKTLLGLSTEELIAQLDEIDGLDISAEAKAGLQGMLIGMLAQKDPKLVLDRFADRMNDERNGTLSWQIANAFQQWATKDSAAAVAWLDAQLAAGKFESKSLDGRSDIRQRLEGSVIASLIATNPAAAIERLAKIPEEQRVQIFQSGLMFNMKPGSEKAIADLVRSQLPENERASVLAQSGSMLVHQGGYDRVAQYLKDIDATSAEREAIVSQSVQSKVRNSMMDAAKLVPALEEGRVWAEAQAPGSGDRTVGNALGSMHNFKQASEIALSLYEKSNSDAILVAFLEGPYAYGHQDISLPILEKISDPAKREELRKRISPQPTRATEESQ